MKYIKFLLFKIKYKYFGQIIKRTTTIKTKQEAKNFLKNYINFIMIENKISYEKGKEIALKNISTGIKHYPHSISKKISDLFYD